MKTYKECIKPPKNGYKYSDKNQQTAQLAEMIGNKHCLIPETVFNWIIRFNIPIIQFMPKLMDTQNLLKANSALLEDILNNKFEAIKDLK